MIRVYWWWETKWFRPEYGLTIDNYHIGDTGWHDGHFTEVVRVNYKKGKFKVRDTGDW